MHRLNGEDAGFLHMERPEQPMNSMAVGVLDPGPPLTTDDVRRHLARRLEELPSFRWRIVPVPWGLHHPVAVPDPDFDLDAHLRHVTLASPDDLDGPEGQAAGDQALEALFARLAEERLDRDRPLWQLTLVDGLDGGRQALVLKYHHCLADGSAAVFNFSRVFDDRDYEVTAEPFVAERLPGRFRLLRDALLDHLRALPRLPRLVADTRRGARAAKRRAAESEVVVPGFSGQGPWTPLNDAASARRSYVRAELALADLKQVKEASGTTLNDVVLAVLAGALRRYLPGRGGVPQRPLLTTVPVSTEPTDALVRQSGNHFWSFTTSLATDADDPWERLHAISACAREGKLRLDLLGVDLVPRWLDVVPPLLARRAARSMFPADPGARDGVDANILISNVRGPAQEWSLAGRTVRDLHVDGPPSNGVGVNVMLWSYGDRMLLGILGFADALDDPAELRRAIEESHQELVALAGVSPRTPRSHPGTTTQPAR